MVFLLESHDCLPPELLPVSTARLCPVNQFLPGGLSALTGGLKERAGEQQPLQEGH